MISLPHRHQGRRRGDAFKSGQGDFHDGAVSVEILILNPDYFKNPSSCTRLAGIESNRWHAKVTRCKNIRGTKDRCHRIDAGRVTNRCPGRRSIVKAVVAQKRKTSIVPKRSFVQLESGSSIRGRRNIRVRLAKPHSTFINRRLES
jgi:hypothetical protein